MDGRYIESRRVMWAVAEVSWHDASGAPHRLPATLEDTSASGACVRVQRPFMVGSYITIKWHREHFRAIARNCRKDGNAFLLGVRREAGIVASVPMFQTISEPKVVKPQTAATPAPSHTQESAPRNLPSAPLDTAIEDLPPRPERKVMQPKTIFPHFWRRPQDGDAPAKPTPMEAPINKPTAQAAEAPSGSRGELLSYEDIYRAAGILSPGSGYGIHKVVDMMNNERIRDLSNDAKRASVLMALDAAGISPDDLHIDATRRQNALGAYETAQKKQLEDFEERKAQENARIEEEMEKIRMHYAQRIQKNLDQVAKEKDALRNWQMAMQHESQRISDVIELCAKPPAVRTTSALAAAAGAQDSSSKTAGPSGDAPRAVPRTSL